MYKYMAQNVSRYFDQIYGHFHSGIELVLFGFTQKLSGHTLLTRGSQLMICWPFAYDYNLIAIIHGQIIPGQYLTAYAKVLISIFI